MHLSTAIWADCRSYCIKEGQSQNYFSLLCDWLIFCLIEAALFSHWQCWILTWKPGELAESCRASGCQEGGHCVGLSMTGRAPRVTTSLSPPALTNALFRAGPPENLQHRAHAGWESVGASYYYWWRSWRIFIRYWKSLWSLCSIYFLMDGCVIT